MEMKEINETTPAEFILSASYFELYQESCYDLLSDRSLEEQKGGKGPKLFETKKKHGQNWVVTGAVEEPIVT